jgi:hypothetical protein
VGCRPADKSGGADRLQDRRDRGDDHSGQRPCSDCLRRRRDLGREQSRRDGHACRSLDEHLVRHRAERRRRTFRAGRGSEWRLGEQSVRRHALPDLSEHRPGHAARHPRKPAPGRRPLRLRRARGGPVLVTAAGSCASG